jgi:hypothetical protein
MELSDPMFLRQGELSQGAAMPYYRAYILNAEDHFVSHEELVCDCDSQAVEQAKRLVDGHDVELWNGERLIIRLEHNKK